jgi:hypothetical protein
MNGSIVIGMEAAGRTRQGIAPAQPCATRDSAQINSKRGRATVSRNSAAYQPLRMRAGGSDDRALNRGGIVANVKFLPASFQSALSHAFADTGGLRGFLPAFRLRFNSFRPLAGWSFHALLQFLQEPTSRVVKCFHVFLSLLPTAPKNGRRMRQGVVRA